MTGTEIHGFCDERFAPLKDAFAANFAEGLEVGAAVAATVHGEPVVDLWAGHADFARTRPWERDTTVAVYSNSKVALILAFLILVDRGLVDLDATVATYWPEFAQGGKARVTVREAMSHRAGVPGFDPPVEFAFILDWDRACARLAAQTHWFGGEPRICYHLNTYGFLLGEILRRVDGRMASRFFKEEIAEKAGLDLNLGPPSAADLASRADAGFFLRAPGTIFARNELARRIAEGSAMAPVDTLPTAETRLAENPGGKGAGSPRSLARMGAIAANGGELDGERYLSQAIVDEAVREQAHGIDPYLGEIRFGLGFGLNSPGFPVPSDTCFHWGGYGGSWMMMDRASGFSFAYAPNNLIMPDDSFGEEPRLARWLETLFQLMPRL